MAGKHKELGPCDEIRTASAPETITRSLGWVAPVEIRQRAGQLVVRADLPGVALEDVSVRTDGEQLVIEAERRPEREQIEGEVVQSERGYGRCVRRIPMPRDVDVNSAIASLDNGVLEISLTLPARKTRVIDVRRHEPIRAARPSPTRSPDSQSIPPTDRNGPTPVRH
ncbi:MAG: Hsp20/alpha crystallin family protein [Labilithrix sp.]|nr:Hsp20/alpha crystallin family protein [Labilithrix sp.]